MAEIAGIPVRRTPAGPVAVAFGRPATGEGTGAARWLGGIRAAEQIERSKPAEKSFNNLGSPLSSLTAPSKKNLPDPENPCSLAVIDGALCRVNRKGRIVTHHPPVGSAIVQFLSTAQGSVIVRELGDGFLPGLTNLYCLDAALNLLWFADQPSGADFYADLGREEEGCLVCTSTAGIECRIDLAGGRTLGSSAAPARGIGVAVSA